MTLLTYSLFTIYCLLFNIWEIKQKQLIQFQSNRYLSRLDQLLFASETISACHQTGTIRMPSSNICACRLPLGHLFFMLRVPLTMTILSSRSPPHAPIFDRSSSARTTLYILCITLYLGRRRNGVSALNLAIGTHIHTHIANASDSLCRTFPCALDFSIRQHRHARRHYANKAHKAKYARRTYVRTPATEIIRD